MPVITRNQEKTIQKMAEKKEKLDIPPFKRSGSISIENWIKLFERLSEEKVDERSKIIMQYLEEEALNFFIERDLHLETWDNIKVKLTDYFSNEKVFSMQEFLSLKLENCENIEQYFRKKTDAAAKLKIDIPFLIQILINGLPHELKTLNLTKNFATPNDWIAFNKPIYYHIQEDNKESRKEERPKMTPRGIPTSSAFPNNFQRWRFPKHGFQFPYQETPFSNNNVRRPFPPPVRYESRQPNPFYFAPRWPQRLALTGSEPPNSNIRMQPQGVLPHHTRPHNGNFRTYKN